MNRRLALTHREGQFFEVAGETWRRYGDAQCILKTRRIIDHGADRTDILGVLLRPDRVFKGTGSHSLMVFPMTSINTFIRKHRSPTALIPSPASPGDVDMDQCLEAPPPDLEQICVGI